MGNLKRMMAFIFRFRIAMQKFDHHRFLQLHIFNAQQLKLEKKSGKLLLVSPRSMEVDAGKHWKGEGRNSRDHEPHGDHHAPGTGREKWCVAASAGRHRRRPVLLDQKGPCQRPVGRISVWLNRDPARFRTRAIATDIEPPLETCLSQAI